MADRRVEQVVCSGSEIQTRFEFPTAVIDGMLGGIVPHVTACRHMISSEHAVVQTASVIAKRYKADGYLGIAGDRVGI